MKRANSSSKILTTAAIGILTSALFLTTLGCKNPKTATTSENFISTIDGHFIDHSDCLLVDTRFPYETSDPAKTKQMDSLVTALLLTKSEEKSIHASRYTPTTAGARYAPRFCYGHRRVTTIDGFTPPAVANGFNETQVTYHYSMQEVPVWAKTPEVLAAFPDAAKAINGQATATITLAQSPVGWQVPN
jgi:hypothetical protein